MKDVKAIVAAMAQKLFEHSPILSVIIRSLAIFAIFNLAIFFVSLRGEVLSRQLTLLMNLLILSPSDRGNATSEFLNLRDNGLNKFHLECENFDEKLDQLDEFFFSRINQLHYKSLPFVLQIIFMQSVNQCVVG